jgi:hypothetical protein
MWGFFVFIYVRDLIKKILKEEIKDGKVICNGCGWSWDLSDGGDDKYMCHKCGHDNTPKPQSNFQKLLEKFKSTFPKEFHNTVDEIGQFVIKYIKDHNFNVKFLNSCYVGYSGVRTKNEIIICSPNLMTTFGDFIYTIFHEIRHEEQIRDLKMDNPLSEYDLGDFERLSEKYWEMELDADKFAKQMIAQIVVNLKLPMDISKQNFKLSEYVENYPSMSKMIRQQLQAIVMSIIQMKKSGEDFTDISDHPMVKKHLDKLEDFI